ncbi:MAG: glutamine amidotransferase [Candidatus Omnitrophica bacterium CG11_big_fil_rev_8_21_14_0_20_45_26]|uniref:Glutamine amidotransferase n=1 Tax=Candidatus Abzuiibacterium crystallinum TaxID=1974748 RepID=A0A2H0LPJ5_9BACT|nr:MAG: glutamine amidotransferase [Candidatus Omnitrophica bacterium CG11_big_fil_rev_8_21_14_0_20_45_26]PIW64296.1 MAG: glutamine amidotransferase [Candidatus Omnitrophica bacterium CG12_big_fil_rev_8_21_14_0_65_45_16]
MPIRNALIIKHVPHEGGGTLEEYLKNQSVTIDCCELSQGQVLPKDPSAYELILIMGGPMNVDEHQKYPFLPLEKAFIQRTLKSQVPMVGICLGAQLIAQALGTRVYRGPQKEIGWKPIAWTQDAQEDEVLKPFAKTPLTVLHWHGDTFDLPKKARRLASTDLYENQAFRFGERVYAFQFHIETTPAMLKVWFKEDLEDLKSVPHLTPASIEEDTQRYYPQLEKEAFAIYEKLFNRWG